MQPQTWSVLFFGVVLFSIPVALVAAEMIGPYYRDRLLEEASTIARWTRDQTSDQADRTTTRMPPVRLRVWDAVAAPNATWGEFLADDDGSKAVLPGAVRDAELDGDRAPGEVDVPAIGESTNQASLRFEVGRRRAQANAIVHLGAGVAAGFVFAALVIAGDREAGFDPLGMAVLWLAMCVPALPVIAGVLLPTARVRWIALGVFVAIVALGIALFGSAFRGSPALFVSTLVVPALAAPAMVVGRWRTTAPVFLLLGALVALGVILPFTLLASLGSIVRLTGDGFLSSAIALVGWATLVATWLVGRRIERRHLERRLSDQLLLIDVWWLFIAIGYVAGGPASGLIGAPLGFAAYWFSSRFGYVVASGMVPTPDPLRLVVLRVFSSGIERSDRVLRPLDRLWRPVGNVDVLADADDLAAETLEPDELLAFLSGTLRERFVKDVDELNDAIANPTVDGRYGVRQHFCHRDIREAVASRLIRRADAIALDLRGLESESQRHRDELTLLVHRVPLGKALLIVDASTDRHIIVETIEAARPVAPHDGPNVDGGTIGVLDIGLAAEIPEEPLVAAILEQLSTVHLPPASAKLGSEPPKFVPAEPPSGPSAQSKATRPTPPEKQSRPALQPTSLERPSAKKQSPPTGRPALDKPKAREDRPPTGRPPSTKPSPKVDGPPTGKTTAGKRGSSDESSPPTEKATGGRRPSSDEPSPSSGKATSSKRGSSEESSSPTGKATSGKRRSSDERSPSTGKTTSASRPSSDQPSPPTGQPPSAKKSSAKPESPKAGKPPLAKKAPPTEKSPPTGRPPSAKKPPGANDTSDAGRPRSDEKHAPKERTPPGQPPSADKPTPPRRRAQVRRPPTRRKPE